MTRHLSAFDVIARQREQNERSRVLSLDAVRRACLEAPHSKTVSVNADGLANVMVGLLQALDDRVSALELRFDRLDEMAEKMRGSN